MVDGVCKKIGINCETCWTLEKKPHDEIQILAILTMSSSLR